MLQVPKQNIVIDIFPANFCEVSWLNEFSCNSQPKYPTDYVWKIPGVMLDYNFTFAGF